jgi:tripartite-type tricarboxylate transporter receptor subunit TctC
VLGTKMKIITGYKGGGALNLAMERGEVQGRSNYYSGFTSVHPEWIREHKIKFLITMGNAIPQLPNVPSVHQFLKPGSIDAKVDKLMEMNFVVGQAFYLPPGVPADVVSAMRKSFSAMLADPATRKDCEKRTLDFAGQDGETVHTEIVDAFKAANPAVVKRFGEIMGLGHTKS